MMRVLVVLLLCVTLCPSIRADEQADLDRDGFAVGAEPVRFLVSIYRSDGPPVFVTTDSVIAVYYTLARRVIGGLGNGVRESLGPWLIEWDEAVRDGGEGEAGRIARAWSATLRSLCTRPPTDLDGEIAVAMHRRLARLRGEREFGGPEAWESGSRNDEARLSVVWKKGLTTPRDRFFTAVHWITRIELPDSDAGREALALLAATMPGALRARVSDPFLWIGLARVSFPGRRAVLDIKVPGDSRFPPDTLPDHAHVFGLDLGRRLGSSLARELLAAEPIMKRVLPAVDAEPVPGSLAEDFEGALRATLDAPDPAAPPLFATRAWRTLALQSALAGHALFRRAAGPFHEPYRLMGSSDFAGFVHPDPAFFARMAKLAKRTAADARRLGTDAPPRRRGDVVVALERHLRGKAPLSAEHLTRLRTIGLALQDIESLGTEAETPELENRMWRVVLPFLRRSLRGSRNRFAMYRPADVLLDKLGEICHRFEAAAKAQLAGTKIEDARQLFTRDWINLLEDVEFSGAFSLDGADGPYCAAVVGVGDLNLEAKLWQGSAGLRTLHLNYPVDGKPVLTRGAVLAYREHQTEKWLDDKAWACLIENGIPKSPRWAK